MVGKDAAIQVEAKVARANRPRHRLLGKKRLTRCCKRSVLLANTSKTLALPYKAHRLKLSLAALTATILGQLCQDLKNMSRGGTTMAASVWVSQLEVEYEEVEAT